MATDITIPDFDFSGFYYPEILEALIQYKRTNVPELTDESEFEPFIQLLRAFALVGHLNNTLIDLVANEHTLPTAKLAETVRNQLRLIEYEMSPATPAQVDVVYELSKIFAVTTEVVSELAQAATKREGTIDPVYFESLEALSVERTDEHSYVLAEESSVFTDYTAEANSPTTPADDWTPWATPAIGDAIYWGHKQAMWNQLGALLTTGASGITGVFEFYDGDWRKTAPTSVTDLGATLEFDLTTLLGASNRQGTTVRVQLNQSTASEDVVSTWDGSKNIATTGLLGQSSPSTDEADYTIGSDWTILSVTDGTLEFAQDGDVEYTLPQTLVQDWTAAEVDGKEAFWLRYRIIQVAAPTSPVFIRTRMDEGKTYVIRSVTQGRTHTESPFSSVGTSGQEFETSKEHFLWGSEAIYVDAELWERVSNFLGSESGSKVYVVELGENDKATWIFGGDGEGKVPPVGIANITSTLRYGADEDGNAGADTIVVDKTGLTYVNKLWNPRQATGWQEAEGASEASLERVKIEGPATVRVKTVALGPSDVEELTKQFTDTDGASPFSRASVFEEGYGPKTMEVVVVAAGGGLASGTQLAALELYFNGDKYASPPAAKHVVANQEVVAVNYTQKSIDIAATVYGVITVAQITNLLTQLIQPEALKEDGVTWEWDFGGTVPDSRINHEIFDLDETITKVVLTAPVGDTALQPRELPVAGTISITVITP